MCFFFFGGGGGGGGTTFGAMASIIDPRCNHLSAICAKLCSYQYGTIIHKDLITMGEFRKFISYKCTICKHQIRTQFPFKGKNFY